MYLIGLSNYIGYIINVHSKKNTISLSLAQVDLKISFKRHLYLLTASRECAEGVEGVLVITITCEVEQTSWQRKRLVEFVQICTFFGTWSIGTTYVVEYNVFHLSISHV